MGFGLFLFATVAVYAADAYVYFRYVPGYTSWMTVAAVTLGTALAGLWFMRQQSLHNLRQGASKLMHGQPPANNLVEAALIVVGGILLILPGLVSDLAGLALLFPGTRVAARNLLAMYVQRKLEDGQIQVSVQTASY